MCVCTACVPVWVPCESLVATEVRSRWEIPWSNSYLVLSQWWVLEIESGFSGRTDGSFQHQDLFLAPNKHFEAFNLGSLVLKVGISY